jgi:hypothetical protein
MLIKIVIVFDSMRYVNSKSNLSINHKYKKCQKDLIIRNRQFGVVFMLLLDV